MLIQQWHSEQKIKPCCTDILSVVLVFADMVTAERHTAGEAPYSKRLKSLKLFALEGRKAESAIE